MTPDIDTIQPVVLVGGASARFGRDKLREPLDAGGAMLVDRAIGALRDVFGPRVVCVGDCHPDVGARADSALPDAYPGAGPAGGVLSALEAFGLDVFVLAGDLPGVTAAGVRAVLDGAAAHPAADRVLACARGGETPEPCIGVYRQRLAPALRSRINAGRRSLHDLAADSTLCVPLDPAEIINANDPETLRRAVGGAGGEGESGAAAG